MTDSHARRFTHASVEDYDDDQSVVIPSTKEFAKSTKNHKDGSDSGYGSRVGTVDGDSPQIKTVMAEVKQSHAPVERERQPYAGGSGRRESVHEKRPASRPSAPARTESNAKPFRHQAGMCWTCDQFGHHLTQEEVDDLPGQDSSAVVVEEDAPSPLKRQSSKSKRVDPEKIARRMSSQAVPKSSRPFPPSATPVMMAMYAMPGPYHASYATSPGVAMYPQTHPGYATPQMMNPATPTGGPHQTGREYFPIYRDRPQRPTTQHRNSMYADSKPLYEDYRALDYTQPESQRPQQSKQSEAHRRPRPAQNASYDDRDHYLRRTNHHEDLQDTHLSRRYSTNKGSSHAPLTVRTRDLSPQRKQPTYEPRHSESRLQARHTISDSHSTSKHTTVGEPITRSSTEPTDIKLAQAEAYQEQQGSKESHPIHTTRASKQSSASHARTRSETGSNHSHQPSHYTTSTKASTKSSRARRESIVIETSRDRPLSIAIPNGPIVTIGTGSPAKSKPLKEKETKLIESAGGGRSRAATSSYVSSSSDRGREREGDFKTIKRIEHVIGASRPPSASVKTTATSSSSKHGRSSSRTGSRSRASTEGDRRR